MLERSIEVKFAVTKGLIYFLDFGKWLFHLGLMLNHCLIQMKTILFNVYFLVPQRELPDPLIPQNLTAEFIKIHQGRCT